MATAPSHFHWCNPSCYSRCGAGSPQSLEVDRRRRRVVRLTAYTYLSSRIVPLALAILGQPSSLRTARMGDADWPNGCPGTRCARRFSTPGCLFCHAPRNFLERIPRSRSFRAARGDSAMQNTWRVLQVFASRGDPQFIQPGRQPSVPGSVGDLRSTSGCLSSSTADTPGRPVELSAPMCWSDWPLAMLVPSILSDPSRFHTACVRSACCR